MNTTHRTPRTWLAPLLSGAVALMVGALLGWFGHEAYMRHALTTAFEDLGADLESGAELEEIEEPGAEMVEADEETGNTGGAAPEADSDTDGAFTYEVADATTAASYNDSECGSTYQADGEFYVFTVEAENTGSSPAWPAVNLGEVTGYAGDGTSFTTFDDICGFIEEINPGGTATYEVVIDAPSDTEITVLQLSSMDAPDVATIPAQP